MSKFIVFEGIDGSGKTSIARALPAKLGRSDLILTEEPTKTWLGDAVKRSHKEKMDPITEAFLFLADRTAHTESIRGWLAEGKTVLCDRYYHSTVAYQGAAIEGKVDFDPISWLLELNLKVSLEPDIVFFFKVDPEIAIKRVNTRGKLSKFERLDFLRKVAANYDRLTRMCRNVTVIDSSGPLASVLDDVLRRL